MVIAFLIVGGVAGALIAIATLLTFNLGPIAALMVFWIGGLASTMALAISFARNTTLASVTEESTPSTPSAESS